MYSYFYCHDVGRTVFKENFPPFVKTDGFLLESNWLVFFPPVKTAVSTLSFQGPRMALQQLEMYDGQIVHFSNLTTLAVEQATIRVRKVEPALTIGGTGELNPVLYDLKGLHLKDKLPDHLQVNVSLPIFCRVNVKVVFVVELRRSRTACHSSSCET